MFRLWVLALVCSAQMAMAQESFRVATFNVGLGRDGPGLLLKDILSRDDDIMAIAAIIADNAPDILLITNFDGDYRNIAAQELIALLDEDYGSKFPHFFASEGNSGQPSGLDLNMNGYLDDWADNWGFGLFPGHENMLLLSKFPIDPTRSNLMTGFLWKELPNATGPENADGSPFLSAPVWDQFRLASKDFWDLTVILPNGKDLHVLASHATPPVFDGPENLNGLRSNAEVGFWRYYLDQNLNVSSGDFVITADFNADPADGAGVGTAINTLLADPRINDPQPRLPAEIIATVEQTGINATQIGDPATDTANWSDEEVGNLRVDYVLPSTSLEISATGIFWPMPDDPKFEWIEAAGTAHRLVWVDLILAP